MASKKAKGLGVGIGHGTLSNFRFKCSKCGTHAGVTVFDDLALYVGFSGGRTVWRRFEKGEFYPVAPEEAITIIASSAPLR